MKPLPVIQDAASAVPAQASPSLAADMTPDAAKASELEPRIVEALKTVFDPEIPVNIYELGLIYDILVVNGRDDELPARVHVNAVD